MTADDTVTIPRELAERIYSDMAFGAAANELAAILNPPPEFDPEAVSAMVCMFKSTSGPLTSTRAKAMLANGQVNGWEMVRSDELEALREFTALLFEGEEPELTDDELAYGIYFSDRLTDAQFYAPLSSAQRDAIRKAGAAQR